MTLRIVRLGMPRLPQEGTRIGAVRRPPRGVRKERYAAEDWFDVWYPDLAPSLELMSRGKAAVTASEWNAFVRSFRAEMNEPMPRRTLDLLVALSRDAHFSIGCYCEDEARCHRSVLRELLTDRGAIIASLSTAMVRISYPMRARAEFIKPLVASHTPRGESHGCSSARSLSQSKERRGIRPRLS